MKILIVDDSALLHERLRTSILKLDQFTELCHAYDMKDAINSFSAFHPDLVILDISLPDGSGLNLIPEFRKQSDDVKIMVVSNYSGKEIVKKCFENGADDFYDKMDLFKLMDCISRGREPLHHNS